MIYLFMYLEYRVLNDDIKSFKSLTSNLAQGFEEVVLLVL